MSKRRFADPGEVAVVRNLVLKLPVDITIPTAEMVDRTGLDVRVLRDALAQIVHDGVPVIANRSAGGYMVCTDPKLIEAEVNRLESHAREIQRRSHGLRVALQKFGAIPPQGAQNN